MKDLSATTCFRARFVALLLLAGCGNRAILSRLQEDPAPPNSGFTEYLAGVEYYQNMERQFPATGRAAMPERLHLEWPVASQQQILLTRYGTPTIILTAPTETRPAQKLAFLHAALDITRVNVEESQAVRAPVTGEAAVVSFRGATPPFAYDSAVVIRDDASGLLVALLHLDADQELFHGQEKVRITRGTIIGQLAKMVPVIDTMEAQFRHTHVSVIDMETRTLLNPLQFVTTYKDAAPPTLVDAYLLNAAGERLDRLTPGAADLVIEAFDRDDFSAPNFDISALQVEVTDDRGQLVWSLPKCGLESFSRGAMSGRTPHFDFIDFGNAIGQSQGGIWASGGSSDSGNVDRTFRYIASRLRVPTAGGCETASLRQTLTVSADARSWSVHVTLWDHAGNVGARTTQIVRPD